MQSLELHAKLLANPLVSATDCAPDEAAQVTPAHFPNVRDLLRPQEGHHATREPSESTRNASNQLGDKHAIPRIALETLKSRVF
jgi:hypothetical protein